MRSWSKHISALFILALGLIACFSPGTRDVVEDAAQRLPADTPLFGAIASPEPSLRCALKRAGYRGASA